MTQVLLIAYAVCGLVTIGVAIWMSVADDPETYFWGVVLWPVLLVALVSSLLRAIWTGSDPFHEDERARVRRAFKPALMAGFFRFRLKRRTKAGPKTRR